MMLNLQRLAGNAAVGSLVAQATQDGYGEKHLRERQISVQRCGPRACDDSCIGTDSHVDKNTDSGDGQRAMSVEPHTVFRAVSDGEHLALQRAPQSVRRHDSPTKVLEAIVMLIRFPDLRLKPGDTPLYTPSFYTDVEKSVLEPSHMKLLREWHTIATSIHGEMARDHIKRAVDDTAPIVKEVTAQGGAMRERVTEYTTALEELTQRAAKEEVEEEINVGLGAERQLATRRPEKEGATDDEGVKTLAERAEELGPELLEASHKISEKHTTHEVAHEVKERLKEVNERLKQGYDEELRQWMVKVFKDDDLLAADPVLRTAPDPPPVTRMPFADGMAFVKGGLDAVSAILAIKDPKARRELFKHHAGFFGTLAGDAEISKVLFQFVSGGLMFYGAGAYGMAKIAGKEALAEHVLDVTVHRIGNVAGTLYLIGAIHGVGVLLDPKATSREKAEATVETVSSTVALAGFASRWVPRLAPVAEWSGPLAASLSLNFAMITWLGDLGRGAEIGLRRQDWVSCFKATQKAAQRVQREMKRLAVADALLAFEQDVPRKRALIGMRDDFVERQLKPYFAARFAASSAREDRDSCGPALKTRLRPIVPLMDDASKSNKDALEAGAAFLQMVATALSEWDQIVMAKGDEGPKAEHFGGRWVNEGTGFIGGRRGVVITNIGTIESGVVHMRHDADIAAGEKPSIVPDEPYFKADLVPTPDWSYPLIPGQVVRAVLAHDGRLSVALDSLRTPVLNVSSEEKQQAADLLTRR